MNYPRIEAIKIRLNLESASNKHPRKTSKVEQAPVSNNRPMQGGAYLKNSVLFESVGWLFENYMVVFGVILLKKIVIFLKS